MADKKISELATATSSIGGYIPIVIGGVTKKVLVASAFDYISTSDGNGGQPPAPRPTAGAPAGGANAPGQFIATATITAGNTVYYSGSSNLTGTWMLFCSVKINASGLPDFNYQFAQPGAGTSFTVPAGETAYAQCWRVS